MVYGMNPTTIKVVWRYVQPSLEEEPLQGYKVNIHYVKTNELQIFLFYENY